MVRELLAQVAAADPELAQFAASGHRYRLNPPVDEATLARAETAIGAPLPDDYRHFVCDIGDGGAGPYYGVLPLGGALDRLERALGSLDSLGKDCPLTTDVDFEELTGKPPEELSEVYSDRPWLDGRLPIVDYGCGAWFSLVVRGPRRGTVWLDSTDDSTGLYCLEVGFLTFYRRWLDDVAARAALGEAYSPNAHYSFLQYGDNPRYRLA